MAFKRFWEKPFKMNNKYILAFRIMKYTPIIITEFR